MTSVESTYLTALYLRQELLFFRDNYQNKSIGYFDFFMKLKPHIISLYNSKVFLDGVGIHIRDNETICSNKRIITKHLECCNYLRNKVCGHLDDEFCEMAKKWEPSTLMKWPQKANTADEKRGRVDLFIKALMESAFNSFIADNPTQTFFSGEIDIFYPPNYKEVMCFIEFTNEHCIQLLTDIAEHLRPKIHFYERLEDAFDAIKTAAELDFGVRN